MSSIHPWVFGLAAKPQHLQDVTQPTHEAAYPVHRYNGEIDPAKKQCGCGTVTDWVCERCEELYCEKCMGHCSTPDGPVDKNFCESCMTSYMDRNLDD